MRGVGVNGKRGRLAGKFIGPFGALINPALDDFHLRFAKRSAGRHLLAEIRADQAMVEATSVGVARSDVGLCAATKRVGAAIQPQAVHLELGTVTADAVGVEDRLDVALKIDFAWRLSGADDGNDKARRKRDAGQEAHARLDSTLESARPGP